MTMKLLAIRLKLQQVPSEIFTIHPAAPSVEEKLNQVVYKSYIAY